MREIIPQRLWIAPAADVNSLREFLNGDGRAIVQLAYDEALTPAPREIISCRFPLVDGDGNDPAILRMAVDRVAKLIRSQIPMLVTCSAGLSRSPAVVAAAMSIVNEQALAESLEHLSQAGRWDVSPGFWLDLSGLLSSS